MHNLHFSDFSHQFPNNVQAIISRRHIISDSDRTIYPLTDIVSYLAVKRELLAIPHQVHSNHVHWVDSPGNYPEIDGLISSNRSIILSLQVADCVPLYLFDPEQRIIGLVHSGWRGTVQNITNKAVNLMAENGSNPGNIIAYIGPSIQQCHYQIGEEVANQFAENNVISDEDKYFLDLSGEISDQLVMSGLNEKNIKRSDVCTFEDVSCCSYRRDGEKAGRMFAFMRMI